MSDQNPFEAPRSDLAPPLSHREVLFQKKLASRMIEVRDRGGQSYRQFLRWSALPYLFGIFYFGVVLTLLYVAALLPLFYVLLGVFLGMYIRDYGWVRAIRKTWSFTLKVTDWEVVRKIAEE